MKWLKIGLLATTLSLLFLPLTVEAGSTATVTITACGYVVGSPTGLTLTYISDYEVGISWTMGADAENTMIRAAYGRVPTSITDGYLVYYGNRTYCNDTAVNFEETASQVYYRAWSQSAGGIFETTGISGWIEGVGMTFIGIIMLCGLLIIAGFWRKSQAMLWVAALTWIGFAFWQRGITPAWGTWDIHEILFYIGFLMAIVCMVEAVTIYREEQPEEEMPAHKEPAEEYWEKYNKMMAGIRASSTRIQRRRTR